jgi:hypothetical protein
MNKKETLVCVVLDETGSMMSNKPAAISGFNEYLQGLKSRKETILFSLTKFNSERIEKVHECIPVKEAKELTDKSYQPNANTPLYDAVAKTIKSTESESGKNSKVLFVILTDGEENASQEYKRDDVFKLIKEKEGSGWTFVFLGANQDAWVIGYQLGLNSKWNTLTYDPKDIPLAYRTLYAGTCSYLSNNSEVSDSFFKEKKESSV